MVFAKKKDNENFTTNLNYMDDLYVYHDELGSGGFGKVKSAIHILTGEKVAIKIIDKQAIGDDLPRVTTELEALKHLVHQNICRMYQYIETEEKFFIVMEYCNGGELFDYIVRKERLGESEARHFFCQLVQAIAYIHSMGFAHRDLKPENLLLKEDLQLKVIDFGLCARPRYGLTRQLETCCGSPAYAAPELIQNSAYYGNEADVWSMGVLLYTLLCGTLPFEDESMPKLYKKIMQGVYHEPSFLSSETKELLQAMLTVYPKKRITIKELLVHPWITKKSNEPIKFASIYNKNVIEEDVARELSFFYSVVLKDMISLLKEWRFDYLTATYLILLQKKEQKQPYALPMCRRSCHQNIINSPTIHASLDTNLHLSGMDGNNKIVHLSDKQSEIDSKDINCDSPFEKSYAKAVNYGSPSLYNTPQQLQKIYCCTNPYSPSKIIQKTQETPRKKTSEKQLPYNYQLLIADEKLINLDKKNKENQRPATLRVMHNKTLAQALTIPDYRDENGRPKSVYFTPRRAPVTGIFSPALYRRPKSVDRESNFSNYCNSLLPTELRLTKASPQLKYPNNILTNKNSDTVQMTEADTISDERIPRSQLKTPRLRQRVFKSLERKADKMINLLTPRKSQLNNGPTKLKCIKTMVNVSVTSSTDPNKVRSELLQVLTDQGIDPIQNGWKIFGSKRNGIGTGETTVELEVVLIENLDYVGVKRRRLNGDAFLYKKVCEEILRMAGL